MSKITEDLEKKNERENREKCEVVIFEEGKASNIEDKNRVEGERFRNHEK